MRLTRAFEVRLLLNTPGLAASGAACGLIRNRNVLTRWRLAIWAPLRALLPDCGAGDVVEHDGRRCCPALRSPLWATGRQGRASLGEDQREIGLPWRQGRA